MRPKFLNLGNVLSIFLSLSSTALVGCGMCNLLVSGCMDLSVGSMAALSGVVTCLSIVGGVPVPLAFLMGLLIGVMGGLVNGFIVTKWNISPFIVTLGTMNIFRGLTQIIAQGVAVVRLPKSFTNFGQGNIFGIQFPIIVCICLVILFDTLLRHFRFFRQGYFVGGNEKSAAMTGINVKRVKIVNFVIVSTMAALAGIIFASRFGNASVTIGTGMEMQVITACVIGGASLNGGEGTIAGAFLGAMLMSMLVSALNLLGVDVYWQNVLTGVILVFAVVMDTIIKTRREIGIRLETARKKEEKASFSGGNSPAD
ncbi:MAG: ABC transporter permease [Treponema sp.]|nr:ABC transporter permease [Treponema sp.]